MDKKNKTAILLGATGLVGSHILTLLLKNDNYEKVVAPTRRPLSILHEKLVNPVIDFEKMTENPSLFTGNDLFLCLGTTIKKAGSQAAFERVDLFYQRQAAELAKKNGVQQLFLCSAVDADAQSKIFYNRVKGKLEDELKKMDFQTLHIFQPSLLLGERQEKRFAENIGQVMSVALDKIIGRFLGKYRPIKGEKVAESMVNKAQILRGGIFTHASHEMDFFNTNDTN